jgi:hypothetical protein
MPLSTFHINYQYHYILQNKVQVFLEQTKVTEMSFNNTDQKFRKHAMCFKGIRLSLEELANRLTDMHDQVLYI